MQELRIKSMIPASSRIQVLRPQKLLLNTPAEDPLQAPDNSWQVPTCNTISGGVSILLNAETLPAAAMRTSASLSSSSLMYAGTSSARVISGPSASHSGTICAATL